MPPGRRRCIRHWPASSSQANPSSRTVHREVAEEVGLDVTNLRYLGSQSWPFPNSLMLGFHADYAGGELGLSRRRNRRRALVPLPGTAERARRHGHLALADQCVHQRNGRSRRRVDAVVAAEQPKQRERQRQVAVGAKAARHKTRRWGPRHRSNSADAVHTLSKKNVASGVSSGSKRSSPLSTANTG